MIRILAIESSCDETAAAVVVDGINVLSNVINSQAELHKKYGGVVPEVASRLHVEVIDSVVSEALKKANMTLDEIDAIAVTHAPGLVGSLLVGLSYAKGLAFSAGKPLIGVHHIEGHLSANYLSGLTPPFVTLVASGGHSHIIYVEDYRKFTIMGKTRDDAAGEAFDKVARVLGLPYPGGPNIDKAAKDGCANIKITKPKFHEETLDFSFSGIKTFIINYAHGLEQKNMPLPINDIAASFQNTVVEILTDNTFEAARRTKVNKIALAGGVAANTALRNAFEERAKKDGKEFYCPPFVYCTDNAAMIGAAAYHYYLEGNFADMSLNAIPYKPIGE